MEQLNLFSLQPHSGRKLRDHGIQKAVTHAEIVTPTWGDQAYSFLLKYISTHNEFMVEDVRVASNGIVPGPPHLRAWGGTIVRASKSGLITRIGFRNVQNAKAHATPASVWIKTKI